jgi:hypothetical protein
MEKVVTFLEEEQLAVIRSCCLSPLGLCLMQFSTSLESQVMISRSPMQLDELREIEIVEHDRGINFRNCPFTCTCWVMFLAFPLDFQTREIITQAVGLFGSVINWIDNARCRSRLVLRCKVTLVSRIPRSIAISEGNPMGDQGNSWTMPVFVLNSVQNDVMAGDEDPIPGNGNPHPEHPQQNEANGNGNQFPGICEAVQDLDEVHQENANQGWELPPPPPPQVNPEGWAPWPEPQFEEIDENEVNLVNNLANSTVANDIANGVMQHLEVPQDSHSVSSDVQAFFRAQGAPVTLELPIPNDASANRIVPVAGANDIVFKDDSVIRQLSARFGIHQCFGPSPSVAMLVQDLAAYAQSLLASMPMKEPLPAQSWNFVPATSFADT